MTAVEEGSGTPPPRASPVGFIGLGMMGSRVAANLQSAGFPLVVHNRTRSKAEGLIAGGASWADSPAAVARAVGTGVLMTMTTDRRSLEAVLFGRSGAARRLPPGALVVDLTTIGPSESRAVAERLALRQVHFVDAPVGGSIDAAERHTLLIYVGGEPADVERARPLLEVVGRRVEHFGPVGSGSAAKIVNNLLTTSTMALLGEALALGDAFGLERQHLLEVLGNGGAGSRVLEAKQENLVRRSYPTQFKLSLARKDIRLAESAARAAGLDLRIVRAARRQYDRSAGLGHADEDYSAVVTAADPRSQGPRRTGPSNPTGS
jgi:3-hydroxyisobutyrate dehydrogenase-like beta-hydroxyacid dehydrogenase